MMADGSDSHRISQPLRGAILCCTSIPPEQRSALASRAEEMGATHKLDLTSDVTHLVVGDSDTPKYKYVAKERPDVKVLNPGWVDAVREQWMQGEEPDVPALEEEHRFPALAGLRICLTGFEDLTQRQTLQQLISENGAEYHGDLTKHITHLIALKSEGQKYHYAQLWGIKIVSIEWLQDSIERGMLLEEGLYHPHLPPGERGKDAWVRLDVSTVHLGKRCREDAQPGDATQGESSGRRKLRRTASSKLEQRNSGIWNDIVGGGGFSSAVDAKDEWREQRPATKESQTTSDKTRSKAVTDGPIQKHQIHGADSSADVKPLLNLASSRTKQSTGTFQGCRLCIHGFDSKKTGILQDHLSSHGGILLSSVDELSLSIHNQAEQKAFLVLPHDFGSTQSLNLVTSTQKLEMVTEWWIERCLHRKSLIDPENDLTCRPFAQFPIDGFQDLTVCSTGFDGLDLMHLSKTIHLMGGSYVEYLSPSANVLLWNMHSKPSEKLRHAVDWNVPIVSPSWLWDSVRLGKMKSLEDYLLAVPDDTQRVDQGPDTDVSRASCDGAIADGDQMKPLTLSKKGTALRGCAISVSDELKVVRQKLLEMAKDLGAVAIESDGKSSSATTTHLIHSGLTKTGSPDDLALLERNHNCQTVRPDWLYQCVESGQHIDETDYLVQLSVSKGRGQTKPLLADSSGPPSVIEDSYIAPPLAEGVESFSALRPRAKSLAIDQHATMMIPDNSGASHDGDNLTALAEGSRPGSGAGVRQSHEPAEDMSTSIADLLAHTNSTKGQFSSRDAVMIKTKQASETVSFTGRRPPSRLLGRANSNTSARSASLSRAGSADSGSTTAGRTTNGEVTQGLATPPLASQKVLYDDPEVQEQRDRVLRKMGGKTMDAGGATTRTRSIGVAIDVGAVGTRTRLRSGR